MNPNQPFNDLPALPPREPLESRAVLKACIEARTALMELKVSAELIPNQSVLINVLPLLEARASTEVENIVTTNDELFRQAALGTGRPDPATKEALNYRSALLAGFQSLRSRPLCTATAVEVCTAIKGHPMEVRRVPGTRLANGWTGEVIYTPPEGEALLREKLANWEAFLHGHVECDPLVRMAAAHYQFEAIHPFTDGNGRTGRVLNLLYLVSEGLLREPVLYLSRWVLRNRAEYYRRLNAVTRDVEWEAWVLFMLRGVEETARWTSGRITMIRRLMDATAARLRREAPTLYSRELVEAIFAQPYCRIGNLIDAEVASRQTAAAYLRRLTEMGIMVEVAAGREKLFLNRRFAGLLFGEAESEESPSVLHEEPWEPDDAPSAVLKVLKAADLRTAPGRAGELRLSSDCLRVFGPDRLSGTIRWVDCREAPPRRSAGPFTWYDARARSAARTGRSEWRLYHDEARPAARPGDALLLARLPDGSWAGAVFAPDSPLLEGARRLAAGDTSHNAAAQVTAVLAGNA